MATTRHKQSKPSGGKSATEAQRVTVVRHFNRFYTQQIGVLRRGFLDSAFSLAEARVLYELRHRERTTASELGQDLGLDAGYLSRILRDFGHKGLLVRERSLTDGRQTLLQLSAKGRRVFDAVEDRQREEVSTMLRKLPEEHQHSLVGALQRIEHLFASPQGSTVPFTLRAHGPGDIGWITHRQAVLYHQEYGWNEEFEAKVAEIAAHFILHADPKLERCWIAERDGEILGSIFCVRKAKGIAQLRLLYVEPSARESGVGTRLVDECIAFARRAGYRTITLWTNSVLDAARHIYERSGFQLVREAPHHSFGHDLVGQTWELEL